MDVKTIEHIQANLEQIAKLMMETSGFLTELKYDLKKEKDNERAS